MTPDTLRALLDEYFPACTNVYCSWPAHRCIPNEQRETAERFLERAQALQREQHDMPNPRQPLTLDDATYPVEAVRMAYEHGRVEQREAHAQCEFCQQPDGDPPSHLEVCPACWTGANEGSGWMQRALEAETALKAHAQLVQEMEPYLQHKADCDTKLCVNCGFRAWVHSYSEDFDGVTCIHENGSFTARPDCTCGLAALLRRSPAPGAEKGQ